MPSVYAFQIPGTDIDIGWDDVAVFVAGVGITAAALYALGAPIALAVVSGIGAGILATQVYNTHVKQPAEESKNIVTDGKPPTMEELKKDEDVKRAFGAFQSDVEEAASKDVLAVRQQLQSSLVSYDFVHDGSLTEFRVSLRGPDKIYGFSAFPFIVNIYAPCAEDPEENKVHIQKVRVYTRDSETGQRWWIQTWEGDIILRNNDSTWYFILKAPDPYCGKAKSVAKGSANKETLEELLNAELNKYEICVEIEGYREIWEWKYVEGPNGTSHKELVHVRDVPIKSIITTLSAWRHESSGIYEISGAEGSLPTKFADIREYTAYKTRVNGAPSNVVVRAWATPVHVITSTADYKFCFVANPDYFKPLNVSITDEVSILTYRTLCDGSSSIVSQLKDSFGDLGPVQIIATTMHYKADNNTAAYDTYFVLYGVVKTNDKDLPIWLVAKPAITVLSNREVVLSDDRVEEIVSLLEKGDVTEEDIERIKQTTSSMIPELGKKKQVAMDLKSKCANNDVARGYAEKAIAYYDSAAKALEKLQATDDPAQIATQLKLAKNYEMIADYYADAAEKALYGQMEQAEMSARNAQKVEEVTKKYEPSFLYKVGSGLKNAWNDFKCGLGLGDISDWSLVTIAIFVLISIVIIVVVIGIVISILKLF